MPVDHVNQHERAFRAWPLLTATARLGTTITYKELAERLGIHPLVTGTFSG
jgi:O6-methylguanine-DNA--protein-cysteine methyltransferase